MGHKKNGFHHAWGTKKMVSITHGAHKKNGFNHAWDTKKNGFNHAWDTKKNGFNHAGDTKKTISIMHATQKKHFQSRMGHTKK